MNNKKDNLLIGLIVGILLLSIIPFRLSYAETKNSEETVESSSSSLEKVNNIDTTEIIESSSAVADSEISASETSTEHLSESSSSSDKTEQSTDNSSQKNTLDTTSKEQIEDKDKSKTSIPTLAELENSWDLEEVIDADGYYILLKKYKEKASADVVIPGAVMDGPMVWPIKIQFVDQDKVAAVLSDGKKVVQANILNPHPYIFGEATVEGKILDETGKKVIQEEKKEQVKIAPQSFFPFQFDWKKEELKPGSYLFEGKVITKEDEWTFKKKFSITETEAKEINNKSVFKIQIPAWLSYGSLIIACLTLISMVLVIKRRKEYDH
ncbi:DUF3324 domain-containing protein [Enterococcus raffinosus]|uniref:DUF3324 domain-containing protein n=1 Tax=Enterococcus raffinosus TaxID=71452 RepID=UPI0021BC17DD|nr:DUF3324 domain-containing protein [Enterococcus raffinosus]